MITTCRSLSVLLVDDSLANHKLIAWLLEKRGHTVTYAQSGREALDQVSYNHFDVILMDIKMQSMDGYETAKAIRLAERRLKTYTPIIAITAHLADNNKNFWQEAGMDGYMNKPIDVDRLLTLLKTVSHGRYLDRQERMLRDNIMHNSMGIEDNTGNDDVINFPAIMVRLGSDMELFQKFVEIFDEETPKLLESIDLGIANKDTTAIRRAAHSLRGLAVNFDAKYLVEIASNLEFENLGSIFFGEDDIVERLACEIMRVKEALSERLEI